MNIDERKNYIYNIIYRLSICILPLIVTPYVARVLGAENVGLYTFTSTVASYFILFGKLGLDYYGNRSIAACREDVTKRSKVFWSIYIMQIITSITSILLYVLLITTVFDKNSDIYWIQLMYVASILFDVSWFYYGMEKFKLTTIRSLLSRTFIIICVFTFVNSRDDLIIYTAIMAFSFLIEQLQLIAFLFKYVKKVSINRDDIRPNIIPNVKLFAPLLALSIYSWMDKIMLGVITGSTAIVAFYAYAENIINLPKGIIQALDTVMLPRISNLVANNHQELGIKKMHTSIRFNSFLSCALAFGIIGVAPTFVPLFLGSDFSPTILLTMGLAIVIVPMSISSVVQSHYLIPFQKENIYIMAVGMGALVNLFFNLLLIPKLGAFGAVIGTLLAETTACAYQLYSIRNVYKIRGFIKALLPFLLCGMIEVLVVITIAKIEINSILLLSMQIIIGGSSYLVCCSIYLIYFSKEYSSLKELIESLK